MPSVTEMEVGRSGNSAGKQSTHVRTYLSEGYGNQGKAVNAVKTHAPLSVSADGYTLRKREFKNEQVPTRDIYIVVVAWSHEDSGRGGQQNDNLLEPGDNEFSFSFTGQRVKVDYAKDIGDAAYPGGQRRCGPDGTVGEGPDLKGAINVNSKGEIKGANIIIPQGTFRRTIIISGATVEGSNWIRDRGRQVGTVNDDTFWGFEKEELLLTEFNADRKPSGNYKVTYGFQLGDKEDAQWTGPAGVTIPFAKAGWDHIGTYSELAEDTTQQGDAKDKVPKLKGIYISKQYALSDFDLLGV